MPRKKKIANIDDIYRQAAIHELAGEFAKAESAYRQALAIRTNPGGWGLLGRTLALQGKYREGLAAAKKMRSAALKYRSHSLLAIADCLMGRVHHDAGRMVLAEKYYRESLEAKARPETEIFLGHLLNLQGRSIEAKMSYQRALHIDPQNPEARYNLAVWYKTHKDYERTVKHFRKILETNAGYADTHQQLAMALWHFGSTGINQAKELLEEALTEDIKNVEKHLFLAMTYRLLNKAKDAEREFQFILDELTPDSRTYILYADFLAEKTRRHDEAQSFFRKAIEAAPDNGAAHYYYGKFLLNNDCREEAEEVLNKAAQLGFEKAEMLIENVSEIE